MQSLLMVTYETARGAPRRLPRCSRVRPMNRTWFTELVDREPYSTMSPTVPAGIAVTAGNAVSDPSA